MTNREHAIHLVFQALANGEAKFPGWPEDPVHAAAIVAEESGELVQAALDRYYGRSRNDAAMVGEAAHTAATAIRFLIGLADNVYKIPAPEKKP